MNQDVIRIFTAVAALAFTAVAYTAAGAFAELETMLDQGSYPDTTSLLVTQHDSRMYEAYFSGSDADALQNTRSVTKSVTALAIGVAIGEGLIRDVTDPVAHYFPEGHALQDGSLKQTMTIQELLSMSSPLDCDDSNPDSQGNEENMYPLEDWGSWLWSIPAAQGLRGSWRYCTAGVVILGKLLEQVSGESADQFIESRLLEPLGIQQSVWFHSASGETMTGGGLELTTRDLAKLASLLLHQGNWNGRQIVPAEFINAMLQVHFHANAEQDYGYLIWRRDYQSVCGVYSGWYMAGNGGNAVVIIPELDATMVVTRTRFNTRGMHQETTDLIEKHLIPPLCP